MRIARTAIGLSFAVLWCGLASIQPVVAGVVLIVVLAWVDRERRLRRVRPP